MDPVSPLPSTPQSVPPRHLRVLYIVFAFILFVAIVVGSTLYLLRFKNETANALFIPSVLHTARFLVAQGKTATVYEWGRWHYKPIETNILSVDHKGIHTASLTRKDTGPFEVMVDGNKISSSASPKSGVVLSPDGTKVAYAELWSSVSRASTTTSNVSVVDMLAHTASQWRVVVVDIASKKETIVGQGVAPLFLDNVAVLRFSTDGMIRTDIGTGANTVLDTTAILSPLTTSAKSPDGTLIMWTDLVQKKATVARFSNTALTIIRTYDSINALGDTLGNDALYWVSPSLEGSVVWKYPFEATAPVSVYSFPKSFSLIGLSL